MTSSQDYLYPGSPQSAFVEELDIEGLNQNADESNLRTPCWLKRAHEDSWRASEEDQELFRLEKQLQRMKGANSMLRNSICQVEYKADAAIQEHMQLRKAVTALRRYKKELSILPPKSTPSRSSEAEPFSKWLEEDPAEAFLTFDQEQAPQQEESKSEGQRRVQSAPACATPGWIGLQDKQSRFPPKLELDPSLAATAAVAAAALAFNNNNSAAAILDLVQLAIHRAAAKENNAAHRAP